MMNDSERPVRVDSRFGRMCCCCRYIDDIIADLADGFEAIK